MAGDWIKVEKATARKPEILRIADLLSIHPDHAFGLCVRFWFWCDQLEDGHAPSVTNVTLDASLGHAGFVDALISVGWLRVRQGSLEVPNFDRHLSEGAKTKALSCERQRRRRSKEDVTPMSRAQRDKVGRATHGITKTQEEILIPESLKTEDFEREWRSWVERRKKKRWSVDPECLNRQLSALAKFGPVVAVTTLRESVKNGWQGIFPEKFANGNGKPDSTARVGPGQRYREAT